MVVSDFELDFSSGLFTCCYEHVLGNDDKAFEGMTIECDNCGKTLILQKKDGELMWRNKK